VILESTLEIRQSLRHFGRNAGIFGERESSKMDLVGIYEQLTQVFRDVFGDDSIKVTPEMTAKDVEGWDSLSNIRLIVTIERTFKVKFTTSEIGKLEKVGDLAALIEERC
jgi:acyl carrier protein